MAKIIGFIGSGAVTKKQVHALLDDFIGEDDVRFVLPITKDHFTAGIELVADYAAAYDIPFDAVIDGESGVDKSLAAVLSEADSSHKVVRVPHKIVSLLEKSGGEPSLMVLYDDEDEDAFKAIERASDADIESLDLTSQLDVLELTDDEEEIDALVEAAQMPEEEEEPEPVKEKAPPKSRAKKEPKVTHDEDTGIHHEETPKPAPFPENVLASRPDPSETAEHAKSRTAMAIQSYLDAHERTDDVEFARAVGLDVLRYFF